MSARAAAALGAGGFELRYLESGQSGQSERQAMLAACWNARFEDVPPVRDFPSYKGQRNFPGLYFAACTGRHVGFESWLERDHMMLLDFSPQVRAFSAQPFWLLWPSGGRVRRHAPDIFVRLADGGGLVVDVRADDKIEPEDAEAFEATAAACESAGWGYRRVGVPDPVLAANVRWLAGYRHPRCLRGEYQAGLLEAFAVPAPLLDGALSVGDRIAVLPSVFHLMWTGVLAADLGLGPAGRPVPGQRGRGRAVTVSRPPTLRVGDEVEVGGAVHTVTGLSGSAARLADVTGAESSMALAELLSAPGFRMTARAPAALPPQGLLDALPDAAAEQARWWERHVMEVITGVPPGAPAGTRPRTEYDPQSRTLRQREMAKVAELAAAWHQVPLSTLQRLRLSYEKRGLWGLVDHRAAPGREPGPTSACWGRSRGPCARRRTGLPGPSTGCGGAWSRSWQASMASTRPR